MSERKDCLNCRLYIPPVTQGQVIKKQECKLKGKLKDTQGCLAHQKNE